MAPSIGLLIPAYNAAHFVPRLLSSAANQTPPFTEILVYDDCSTDDTAAVALRYGARIIRGEQNCGCTEGKSRLLQATECDWVHFHDADDVILPNFMGQAMPWTRVGNVDVVVFGCEEREEATGRVISRNIPDDVKLQESPIQENIRARFNSSSGLYRRSSLLAAGGFDLDPKVLYNEDHAFHCKLARAGLRFRGDPTVTVHYMRQSASMWTSNEPKAIRAQLEVMRKALDGPQGWESRHIILERLWNVAGCAGSFGDWATMRRAIRLAVRLGPIPESAGSRLFRSAGRISPLMASYLREYVVRCTRPHLREPRAVRNSR